MGKYAKPSPECGVNSSTVKLATSLGLRSTGLCFLGTCYFVYQLGYLPYPNYRIFTADILSVSSFLSASNIFLIVILLDPPHFLVLSDGTGALGTTFPVLFQLKGIFIYSDQFVQNALYVITPKNCCLMRWRLASGQLDNATDKLPRLKNLIYV